MEAVDKDISLTATEALAPSAQPGFLDLVLHRIWQHPLALTGTVIILLLVTAAALAPWLTSYDPYQIASDNRLAAPSWQHFFGTDDMGRDIFSRVLYGARLSLLAAMVVLILATGIGVVVGAIAGYYGGWVDEILMRTTDMFLAFPAMILAMCIASALGPSLINAMIAVSIVWWPWYARLIRGQILSLKNKEYVEAARALGASDARVLWKYILPNCTAPLIIQITLDIGYAILTTASLSFIGVGAVPPTPEWGAMISVGRGFILVQWWYPTFPGLAIFLAVAGFSLLGDGLRDILDPRSEN